MADTPESVGVVLSASFDRVSPREPTAPRSARRLVFANGDAPRVAGRFGPFSILAAVASEVCPVVREARPDASL
jgi:hypothetical protein